MPVAKSFINSKIIWGPAPGRGGKQYVTVELPSGQTRTVRWYTDAEWHRMYPESKPKNVEYKNILGFHDAGYITIYYGDTYENLDWFKNAPTCRYHKIFGWYTPSDEEVPNDIPTGVSIGKIYWNDIHNEANEVDSIKACAAVDQFKYAEVKSGEYIGEIGERLEFSLTVKKTVPLQGIYGATTMHIMNDENDNTFIWTTGARTLEVGKTYRMKGTVKDHKEYHGVKQTVLTRCSMLKDKK